MTVYTKYIYIYTLRDKPSEFYTNTLPPIPYPLYIFFKDHRIYIPNINIDTLRDKFYLVTENSLVVVSEKMGVAETAELFAVCVLVGVLLPEGFLNLLKRLGWVVWRLSSGSLSYNARKRGLPTNRRCQISQENCVDQSKYI